MKYLVDATVLSEPTKPGPDPRVVQWLLTHERDITVDPFILGDLPFGILILRKGKSGAPWNAGSTRESGACLSALGRGNGSDVGRCWRVSAQPGRRCRSRIASSRRRRLSTD
jgi:hypothetical protein